MKSRRALLLSSLLFTAQLAGCSKAADWTDPEYISGQMSIGSEQAFDEFTRLTPEQQAAVVPTLIDLYNRDFRREKALQSLLTARSPEARDVFRASLQESDTLAAIGARGLAAIGDSESAVQIAQRLATVTTSEAYPAFLEALQQIPTSAAGDVVADVLRRPAPRIGGIGTVRSGCTFLGAVESPSDTVLGGMVFGLVNFIPQPFEDALNECELALLAHGDAAVPKLLEVINGTNTAVNDHLRSIRYRAVVGQLRATAVMAHIHNDAAAAAMTTWFSTDHPVPYAELRDMPTAEQQNWYDQQGQMFTQAVNLLAYHGTPADLATLRRLESTEAPESLLTNFAGWFELSAGAEFGLRTAVQDALSKIGDDTDRELLWTRAESGSVTRGGEIFATELRKNALHYLGRTARPGESARYEALLAAQTEANRVQFELHRVYFLLADTCQDDVACYAGLLDNTAPIMQHPTMVAEIGRFAEGAERSMMSNAYEQSLRTAVVWQLAIRFGSNAAAGEALIANLDHESLAARADIGEALLYIDSLPSDWAARVDTFIAADTENRNPQARAFRHQLRVVKIARAS